MPSRFSVLSPALAFDRRIALSLVFTDTTSLALERHSEQEARRARHPTGCEAADDRRDVVVLEKRLELGRKAADDSILPRQGHPSQVVLVIFQRIGSDTKLRKVETLAL